MIASCPSYRYTFRRDGNATYDHLSQSNGEKLERSIGTIDSVTFQRLAAAMYQRGFFQLEQCYCKVTDATSITVRATLPDTVKVVIEDEGAGPPALHDVQSMVQRIGSGLRWGNAIPQPLQ
jgi:hypothetical protein